MRTVRGLEAARELLLAGRGLDFDTVPAHVAQRTAEVFGERLSPLETVVRIIREVRSEGDSALRRLTKAFEGCDLDTFEVPRQTWPDAYNHISDELVEALKLAAERIRRFHEASMPQGWFDSTEGYGELVISVGTVGCYVPGGTAPLISTLLMTAVPARVAGVEEVFVASPARPDGSVPPGILVAADIAGVDRVFLIGGAQAIAAMAYGTESVPKVDLVCGPGNVFVTLAKKLVFGDVGVDGLFGPTETVLIADEMANPTLCAADLLAQAEHDVLATPVLITTSEQLAADVVKEVGVRVERLERRAIAGESIDSRGVVAIVDNVDKAIDLANEFAPEHMCLMVRDPSRYTDRVRNAGVVFQGELSHEVLGDYVAGPSHVMPTGGTARFGSGVGVRTFLKFTPVVGLDRPMSASLTKAASTIGRAEGLTGHAEAAEIREELLP